MLDPTHHAAVGDGSRRNVFAAHRRAGEFGVEEHVASEQLARNLEPDAIAAQMHAKQSFQHAFRLLHARRARLKIAAGAPSTRAHEREEQTTARHAIAVERRHRNSGSMWKTDYDRRYSSRSFNGKRLREPSRSPRLALR